MKKIISIMLSILLILPLLPITEASAEGNEYEGLSSYKALYQNIIFKDIENHWAKDSINKMAALSIIRGMGEENFNPSGVLTREDALILLARLLGLEQEAYDRGQNLVDKSDTGGYTIMSPWDYWAQGYIEVAQDNGIVTDEEVRNIETITDSQQYNIDIELDKSMWQYYNNMNLTEDQLNNIERQLTQKIEKKYTWLKPVNREQIALWVSRALAIQPISRDNLQRVYNLKDWQQLSVENIPYIEAIIEKGIMTGDDKGYFNPKSYFTRGEMAKLLDNIHEELLTKQGYRIYTGIIDDIETNNEYIDNNKTIEKIVKIKNDDGTVSSVITRESENSSLNRGFISYKDNKLLPNYVEVFDYVKYYVNPQGQVVFMQVLNTKPSILEGTVEEIDKDNGTLSIMDYDGNIYKLPLSLGANIFINNKLATLDDFIYGQDVVANISNGSIIKLDGYLDEGEKGYIHPGERIYIGKVLYIDKNKNTLTLLNDNTQNVFTLTPFTPVMKGGLNVGFENIKEGDIVRLEFDQYEGNNPIKAYIAEPDKQIENILKATIIEHNSSRREIVLKDVKYYDHTKWEDYNGYTKMPLSYNTDIYYNGRKLAEENIKSYLGREAYIITQDDFGKEEAMKIVLKDGYERKYTNSIQEIAFGDKRIKVDYNDMYYDDSTIIVKDGKLIDPYNLNEDDDIFAITHGSDKKIAAFISVESLPVAEVIVYKGRIDEIGQYDFELDDYDVLEGTEWDYSSKQIPFNISEDTWIIDTRDDEVSEVDVEEFTNSRFLKNKRRSDNYYGKYAYVVEYDDMVIAMGIIDKDDDEAQVISIADVKSIDLDDEEVLLKNIRDWNELKEKWNVNRAKIQLKLEDAIIIKDGREIDVDDITDSDSLYILRRNDVGYIIVVR